MSDGSQFEFTRTGKRKSPNHGVLMRCEVFCCDEDLSLRLQELLKSSFCSFLPGEFLDPSYSNVAFVLSLLLEKRIGGQPTPTEASKNQEDSRQNWYPSQQAPCSFRVACRWVPVPGSGRGKATSPPGTTEFRPVLDPHLAKINRILMSYLRTLQIPQA